MEVVVARIGRPHGVRGEVTVQLRTDDPAGRLAVGAVLRTDPAGAGPLTVREVHLHGERTRVAFAGVGDRTAAEALRGVLLLADAGAGAGAAGEPDAWPDADLVGLRVLTADGRPAGQVSGVLHGAAQDLLEVSQPSGSVALVPFVRALVPQVDVAGGTLVVDPPGGLLEAVPEPEDG